jgi:hypothetical protein
VAGAASPGTSAPALLGFFTITFSRIATNSDSGLKAVDNSNFASQAARNSSSLDDLISWRSWTAVSAFYVEVFQSAMHFDSRKERKNKESKEKRSFWRAET